MSSQEQNEDRQLIAMAEAGVARGNIFIDKQSGKDFERPNYKRLMKKLLPGDTLVIKSIDRLGRNYEEIQNQWRINAAAKKRGVRFGRPTKEAPPDFDELIAKWQKKEMPLYEILRQYGMSESTFYRRLRERKAMKRGEAVVRCQKVYVLKKLRLCVRDKFLDNLHLI